MEDAEPAHGLLWLSPFNLVHVMEDAGFILDSLVLIIMDEELVLRDRVKILIPV